MRFDKFLAIGNSSSLQRSTIQSARARPALTRASASASKLIAQHAKRQRTAASNEA